MDPDLEAENRALRARISELEKGARLVRRVLDEAFGKPLLP